MLRIVGDTQTMTQSSLDDISQYLNVAMKEVFKLHAGWFGFQMEPSNHLITKVSALGYWLKIILQTCIEVYLHPLVTGKLGGTQVLLGDCDSLEGTS
jgi:hypothetical protein